MAEEIVKPWGETRIVGKAIPPVDGYERVSGAAVYPLDVILPNMLHGAILHCPHGHAMVKKIDVAKARTMPGVRAVLTDADPEARTIGWYAAPGSPGAAGSPLSRLFDPHCRYEGEEVAAVAAERPQQAWDAVRAIHVEYETLPAVTGMEDALKPGAPAVHEAGNRAGRPIETTRGDVEKGFAEADAVLEETYRTSTVIHAPLEVHGSVARWDGDRLTLWDTSQGAFDIQINMANALNMPLSKVRVISPYMGGAFGAKQEAGKYNVIAALLARKAARPVKLFVTREHSFLAVGNRAAHSMKLKAGVKNDGTLTALQLTATGEVGAYPYHDGAAPVGAQTAELYKCPNVRVEETMVYIHAGRNRAFRAPGFPPGNWALEQTIDALAEKIGMDPVEFRLKNMATASQPEGKPYTSNGLRECLTEGARAFGWQEARGRPRGNGPWVRGVGVASATFGTGAGASTVIVKMYPDGSVNLNMGAADLGTGTKTVMAMIVAEELGVPLDRIQIEHADTGTTQYSRHSGGSKTVFADGPPTRLAALQVKGLLLEMAAEQLQIPVADLVLQDGAILARGGSQKLAVTDLTQLRMRQGVMGIGHHQPVPTDKLIRTFGTHFAEVEVNTLTGEMRVLRMLAAHDSGRVMSLLTYRNQVFGGFLQGQGFAMTEGRVLDESTGRMMNANFHDYKIPTAKDVPGEMTCLPIDPHDTECNLIGTKGLGEPSTIPAGAAIANAFYHATGVRAKAAPITPAEVLTLLAERKTRG